MIQLSEIAIAELIAEQKALSFDPRQNIRWKQKRGHREYEFDVTGSLGHCFRILLRQNMFNPLDFSVILSLLPAQTNQQFRLRRYNGLHGEHKNRIEQDRFFEFHIHKATERYQDLGLREDAFAEPTTNYSDIHQAFDCLLSECSFVVPAENQISLF